MTMHLTQLYLKERDHLVSLVQATDSRPHFAIFFYKLYDNYITGLNEKEQQVIFLKVVIKSSKPHYIVLVSYLTQALFMPIL